MPVGDDITGLLQQWGDGDDAALERLTPYVYEELQRLAASYMRRESSGHTLQPTALVNEAYLRLVRGDVHYQNRKHFYVVAARMMRRVLVDHARGKQRKKRGGGEASVTLNESSVSGQDYVEPLSVLQLDEALTRLEEQDPDIVNAVELIYFGGLSHELAAETIGVSRSKLYDDLRFARAWLKSELAD